MNPKILISLFDLTGNASRPYKQAGWNVVQIDIQSGYMHRDVSNQLQLFQKLHEWHFDLYNLLENNLAIDINKLETNI